MHSKYVAKEMQSAFKGLMQSNINSLSTNCKEQERGHERCESDVRKERYLTMLYHLSRSIIEYYETISFKNHDRIRKDVPPPGLQKGTAFAFVSRD
jgi:hypothetical protein